MALDDGSMRSRRALLGAAIGAAAATAAGAFVRPEPVRAGSDGDVVLGTSNDSASTTSIAESGATGPGLRVDAAHGAGIIGASARPGRAWSGSARTVPSSRGCRGSGTTSRPQWSGSASWGSMGTPTPTDFPWKTGVYGSTSVVLDPEERGVWGMATEGQGVRGEATNGIGVYATATTGTALRVNGKAAFKRSGKATVASGHSYVDVTVAGGLAGTPLCFANLMTYRSGVSVAAVRPNYPTWAKFGSI